LGKGTLIHCWQECKLVQPLWKTVQRLLNKMKIELAYDPAILLLGIYLKECKSGYNKGTCAPIFIAPLFTIAKLWKQPKDSPQLLRDCASVVFIYSEILFFHKEE
jgi:hypothetical protein